MQWRIVLNNDNSPAESIAFVIGTRAEYIKVKPVVNRLKSTGFKCELLWLGLHDPKTIPDLIDTFDETKILLTKTTQNDSILKVLWWAIKAEILSQKLAFRLRRDGAKPKLVVVHGDTLCTAIGSIFAKSLGVQLAHVEACVRSGKLWKPFPEEITRRLISRFANVNFAPGEREFLESKKYSGRGVNTLHNTSRDALYASVSGANFEDQGYLLVTLHRTELLANRKAFKKICEKIMTISTDRDVYWFVGSHERAALEGVGIDVTKINSKLKIWERLSHDQFTKLLVNAHCVITDSGGLQSECHDLGIPVIVMRTESEYSGGSESPWILAGWDVEKILPFLQSVEEFPKPRGKIFQTVASEIIAHEIGEIIQNENK